MQVRSSSDETFVSTGQLPTPETVIRLVEDAYQQFKFNTDGSNSNVYPALERVPSDLFGICVVGTSGNVFGAGAIDHDFAIMSVSKPFVFALVCQELGAEVLRAKIGANATGMPFNSLSAVEGSSTGRTNPMVNAGAIATTSRSRRNHGGEVEIHSRWPFAFRRPDAPTG